MTDAIDRNAVSKLREHDPKGCGYILNENTSWQFI